MRFKNRAHAARLLAERLVEYKGQNPLVLGIPRGAVPMAEHLAEKLDGELDVVLVHKLGAPSQPEFAIGSVSEKGEIYLSDAVQRLEVSEEYIDQEVKRQLESIRRRRARYTPVRPPIDPAGRIVIVVDNGVATGWTMIAALGAVKSQEPKKLVAAMAVAPPGAIARMEKDADEVVCLATPQEFFAVGQFFEEFEQVTDEEVIAILERHPVRQL